MGRSNILVLGSEGAIGTRLVKMLLEVMTSANIIRVGRKERLSNSASSSDTLLKADLLDLNAVKAIFEHQDIGIIIFCAAKWNGLNQDPTVLDNNVTMFNNVLLSLPDTITNFVYLSSSAVYSQFNADDALAVELLPNSTYGKSKLINEVLLLNKAEQNNMAVTIYRPFHVVSPYETYCPGRSHITTDFVHRYVELDIDFNWAELSNETLIPFYWVDDLCGVIIDNLFNEKCVGRVFNIGASKSFSVLSLAFCVATIADKYGLSTKDLPVLNVHLGPSNNGMKSGLDVISVESKERSLLEIVEKFIIKKYGLSYDS